MSIRPDSSCDQSCACSAAPRKRRGALGDDAEPLEIRFGEKQIVRAGLRRHVHPSRARLGDFCDACAAAYVNDMKLRTCLLRRSRSPGRSPRSRLPPAATAKSPSRWIHAFPRPARESFVHSPRARQPEDSDAPLRTCRREACLRRIRKLGQTRVAHEGLESDDPAFGHLGHARNGTGDEAAPDPEVGNRRRLEGLTFAIHGFRCHRARSRIERHVEKQSCPPPAASAWLPVSAPSQSVRPGSLKCRCTSTSPGST